MSRGIIKTADAGNNAYTVSIAGYGDFPGQCVTMDSIAIGSEVEIVDFDNYPPDKMLQFGNLRILPNTGDYTYSPNRSWISAEQLVDQGKPATMAKAYFYSSEWYNPRWQVECPLYRGGKVTSIIDSKYMMVEIWSRPVFAEGAGVKLKCSTDYMACDTAAFGVDDLVVVKFEDACVENPVVVGFWSDPVNCGWTFEVVRGDGAEVTAAWLSANGHILNFAVYDSDGTLVRSTNNSQADCTDDGSNNWTLDTSTWSDNGEDENGYWVSYSLSGGTHYTLTTQYPNVVRTSQQKQNVDLINGGVYAEIAYWRVVNGSWPTYVSDTYPWTNGVSGRSLLGATYYAFVFKDEVISRVFTVYSSVPYQATYSVGGGYSSYAYVKVYSEHWLDGGTGNCDLAEERTYRPDSGARIRMYNDKGSIDNTIEIDPNYPYTLVPAESETHLFSAQVGGRNHTVSYEEKSDATVTHNCDGTDYDADVGFFSIEQHWDAVSFNYNY